MAGRVSAPSRFRLAISGTLLVCYVAIVAAATMWPTPVDTPLVGAITRLLDLLHRHGLPMWFGYGDLEFIANILMFVPLGFLLALALPQRKWWLVVLLIPAVSFGIEIVQGEFLVARFASIWDVAANTFGGYMGAITCYVLRALVHFRDRLVVAEALAGRHR